MTEAGDKRKHSRTATLVVSASAIGVLVLTSAASAKTYHPTRTDDPKPNGCKPNNCSLREAVIAANNTPAPSCRVGGPALRKCPVIVLQPGKSYRLTRQGNGSDSPATGDLDLLSAPRSVTYWTIETAHGRSPATINGNGIDRIIDSAGSSGLTVNDVVLRGGHARGQTTPNDISGANGGAINGGNLKIHNSRLVKNVADDSGGAVYSRGGGLEVSNSRLKKNSAAGDGGALAMDGQADRILAEVTKTRATHNRAGGAGGMAAFTTEAGIKLSRSFVADNRATSVGGAIYSQQGNAESIDVLIDRSTITGNESRASGGGLATSYTEVTNSTISSNRAADDGGGIVARIPATTFTSQPSLQVENSTIANNTASSRGGGVAADSGFASARLVATTVVRNSADQGGGLYQGAGDMLTVQNTIVALNRAGAALSGPDCFPATAGFPSQGHNLIGDPSGCSGFTAAGDLIGGPLQLAKLADNGGPTKTVALQSGSRAIKAGDPAALPPQVVRFDQRGVKRKSPPDIGAYERQKKKKKMGK
jgi:CSLREA domain-containing protein